MAAGTVLLALPGHAAVFGLGETGVLLFSADFQNGINPFTITSANGGSTALLSNYTAPGNYAVSFSDTTNSATANAATTFTWALTAANAPTLISALNAALDKPAGSATDFILDYEVERILADANTILYQTTLFLEPSPNSGVNPADGLDRFPAGQPGMAYSNVPAVPLADYDSDGVLEMIDNTEWAMGNPNMGQSGAYHGLRFRVISDVLGGATQTGADLSTLNLRVTVRMPSGSGEERLAIDNIRIFEVVATSIPEPGTAILLALGGLVLWRKRLG